MRTGLFNQNKNPSVGVKMTKKNKLTLRRLYEASLSVLTVAVGALLIVQALKIYGSSATSPYTREKVVKALSDIAVLLYLWIAAVIGGVYIRKFCPSEKPKLKGTVYQTAILKRLKKLLPEAEQYEKIKRADAIRKIVWTVCVVLSVISAVAIGCLIFDKRNYTPIGEGFDPTKDMLKMLPSLLIWTALFFIAKIAATVYCETSAKKENAEIKKIIATSAKTSSAKTVNSKEAAINNDSSRVKIVNATRIVLAVVSITFIVIGCFNGGAKELFEKAINICTECIGLG